MIVDFGLQCVLHTYLPISLAGMSGRSCRPGAAPQPGSAADTERKPAKRGRPKKSDADRKRARNDDGTYKGDDPSTPDINEAWEQD